MALFLSQYSNKLDKKGRISVPSAFRAVLVGQSFSGIVAYGSFVHECVEACSMERIEWLNQAIDQLDPYSEERDAFATTILGGSSQLSFDSEGRVMLPESLIDIAQLKDQATFVGKGHTFEIWNPELYAEHSQKARSFAKRERAMLRLSQMQGKKGEDA